MAITITVNKTPEKETATLRPLEFLVYKITVDGAQPSFVLSNRAKNTLLSSNATPQKTYQRTWPKGDEAKPSIRDEHAMCMQFMGAVRYRYVVEYHKDDNSVEILIDNTYESQQPEERKCVSIGVSTTKFFS